MKNSSENETGWMPGMAHPVNADRKTLARIISHHYFPVKPRTLRDWPLVARHPNKRAVYPVNDALKVAEERLKAAHPFKQGE